MRSERVIAEEIEKLKAMKPKVRRFSIFGDDNHHSIDVDIVTLEKRMTQSDVDRKYPDDDQIEDHTEATGVVDWMMERDPDALPPSANWLPLVQG